MKVLYQHVTRRKGGNSIGSSRRRQRSGGSGGRGRGFFGVGASVEAAVVRGGPQRWGNIQNVYLEKTKLKNNLFGLFSLKKIENVQ